jgi:hypothetical protein
MDDQISDVVSFLSDNEAMSAMMQDAFMREFPEYNNLTWSGSWVDCDASSVDPDYMSWVADWIESNTRVTWDEGEPYLYGEGGKS